MIRENNMSDKQVKVKAIDRWRVVHDDKPHVKDDVLVVPENRCPGMGTQRVRRTRHRQELIL
jgi:hypothetical protein